MRIRIIRQPLGTIQGVRLRDYRFGHVYDLSSGIAEFLVAEGYAIIEMRDEEHAVGVRTQPERRHSQS